MMLKAIKKNIKHEQVEEFVKKAHRLGIKVWVFSMVSLPEETFEDAMMTIDFIKKVAPYITNTGVQTTRITPDAALCDIAKEKGILPRRFNWFEPYETPYLRLTRPWDAILPIYIEHLTTDQILKLHDRFKQITSKDLASFSNLIQGIKYNLSYRGLKRLSLSDILRKIRLGLTILYYSTRRLRY